MFTRENNGSFTALLVYIDDIILASNDLKHATELKDLIHQQFKLKDLGNLKYFLGLEVAMSDKGISICQWHYTLKLLATTGFIGSKPSKAPMELGLKLCNTKG